MCMVLKRQIDDKASKKIGRGRILWVVCVCVLCAEIYHCGQGNAVPANSLFPCQTGHTHYPTDKAGRRTGRTKIVGIAGRVGENMRRGRASSLLRHDVCVEGYADILDGAMFYNVSTSSGNVWAADGLTRRRRLVGTSPAADIGKFDAPAKMVKHQRFLQVSRQVYQGRMGLCASDDSWCAGNICCRRAGEFRALAWLTFPGHSPACTRPGRGLPPPPQLAVFPDPGPADEKPITTGPAWARPGLCASGQVGPDSTPHRRRAFSESQGAPKNC